MKIEFPQYEQVEYIHFQMREDRMDLTDIEGKPLSITGKPHGGGTMIVYEISDLEGAWALGIPNYEGDRAWEAWPNRIEREPRMVDAMKQLDILANPYMEVTMVRMSGIPVPALKMIPFRLLPFDVRDTKERSSSIYRYPILTEPLTNYVLERLYDAFVPDLARLVGYGFQPNFGETNIQDCINIAVLGPSRIRPFLSDLSFMAFDRMTYSRAGEIVRLIYKHAMIGLLNAVSDDEFYREEKFLRALESDLSYKNPKNNAYRALVSHTMTELDQYFE